MTSPQQTRRTPAGSSSLLDIEDLLAAAETVEDVRDTVQTAGAAPDRHGSIQPGRRNGHSLNVNGHDNGHRNGRDGNGLPIGGAGSRPAATMTNETADSTPRSSPDVIRLTCSCGRRLRIREDQAARRIKCPKCGKALLARKTADPAAGATPITAARAHEKPFAQMAAEIEAAVAAAPTRPAGLKTLSWPRFRALARQAVPPHGHAESDVQRCRIALLELGQSRDRRARDIILPFATAASNLLRQAAATALGDLEDASVAGPLVRLLGDESVLVRKAAVIALGKAGHRAAARPLLMYGLSDPQLKFLASESVAKLGEAAVPELLDLVSGQDAGLALEAIVLLGRIGDKRAVKTLISCVESRSPLLRCHAAEALGKLGDSRARGALLALLDDADSNVRANAAAALIKMPDANCLVPLVKALGDDEATVRRSAAVALGEIGDKRAAESLARLLHVKDEEFALAIAEALAKLGDERALPRLLALLQQPDEAVQLKTIAALRRLSDPRAAPALYDILLCRSPVVRQRAVDALGQIGDAEAAERLEAVLSSDRATEVRAAAARALGEIADPVSIEALVRALNDEFNVRCMALGALGIIGDEHALPFLLRGIEDPAAEIRFHSAAALANFKHPQAIEALQAAAADESEMVRRGAAKSLEKLGAPVDKKTAARVRRARRVRSRVVDWHMALPALLAAFWPDSARGKAVVTGLVLALAATAFLVWPRSHETGGSAFPVRGNVRALAFSPDGTRLALGRTFDLLEIWDPQTGEILSEAAIGGTGEMAFASDSTTLALVAQDKLRLWSLGESGAGRDLGGHKAPITRLAATPAGRVIATLDESGRVFIWSLPGGEAIAGLDIDLRGLKSIDVTPDGDLLACGTARQGVVVWDTESAEPVHKLSSGGAEIVAVTFSADGSRLAASGTDGTIRVWETATGRPIAQLKNQAQRTASLLRFYPDGSRLAAVVIDTIWTWDLAAAQGTALCSLEGGMVETLSFSPDGRQLAAGGSDNREAYLIDVDQGRVAKTLRAPK